MKPDKTAAAFALACVAISNPAFSGAVLWAIQFNRKHQNCYIEKKV
jgi:hypothetical protein